MQTPSDTNGLSGSTNRQVNQAQRSAHDAIDAATEKAHPAVDQVARRVHKATDNLADAASHAAARFDEKSEEFMDAQARLMESAREYIQEKPLQAIGMAVGAGFILSMLMRK
jgi:ElaB/YqjD/DUF883 family membrane-anchored ribosome-binding protein